jgi:hypothetical protein
MELTLSKQYKCCLKKSDYNDSDGILTSVWGSAYWHILHSQSFNYPSNPEKFNRKYNKENNINNYKVQEHYATLIENLLHTLPCGSCRKNLKTNLKNLKWFEKKNFYLKNREKFSKFVYDLHNEVNVMLGKKKYKTYNYVRDLYSSFRAKCPKKSTKHSGCTKLDINNEFSGEVLKGKCKISIVPHDENDESENLKVDDKCSIIAARDRKSQKPNKNNSIYITKPIYAKKRKSKKKIIKKSKRKSINRCKSRRKSRKVKKN